AGGQRGPWRRIKGMLDQGGETVPGTKVSLAGLEALLEHAKQRGGGDGKGGGLAKRILEFLTTGSGPQTVGGVRIEQVDRFAKLVEQRASASPERPNRQRRQGRDQGAAPTAESAATAAAVSVEGLEDWTTDLAEEV
ncbi:MAG: hypothetical protein HQL38_15610, partial [Alphaproteobacteria bacterium]|nr:hypothetical protein [Alphaproteobacteria bacterium]